jgi:hypothetical protein
MEQGALYLSQYVAKLYRTFEPSQSSRSLMQDLRPVSYTAAETYRATIMSSVQ